jgi:hypothetical protein
LDLLIPLMPFLGALPIAVAAVVIAKLWQRRRDMSGAELESQNHRSGDSRREELGANQAGW